MCKSAKANQPQPPTAPPIVDVTIPGPLSGYTQRNPFIEELLARIFAVQGIKLNLQYSTNRLPQARAMAELANNRSINLNWSMTTTERESSLEAIKIPIYKGMIGWRVFFIREGEQEKFNHVLTLDDLSPFKAVQGHDWPDYKILRYNRLKVEGNLKFEFMAKAVKDGLVDYYPRSVLEISRELKDSRFQGLAIESKLLLKYPAAYYFFVHKSNGALAKKIEQGFMMLIENGEFDQLFNQYFAEDLSPLRLDERHTIELNNPFFNLY